MESEAVAKTSILPSPSPPYQLTSSVLSCVEQESELLASLTKLLCGEPGERVASPDGKPKKDVMAQSTPISKRTDKTASTAVSKVFGKTSKAQVTEPDRTTKTASSAGANVVGSRRRDQSKVETELPHCWYNVDIQVEFEHFPWMQRFLQLRVFPFSDFHKAPSEDEGPGAAVQKGHFLKSFSRKQQPMPSKASAHLDLRVSRQVALLPTSHPELQKACFEVFVHVMRRGRPWDALHLLWTEALSSALMHPTLKALKDLAAKMAFLEFAEQRTKQRSPSGSMTLQYKFPEAVEVTMRPVQLLKYMEDTTTAAQMVLSTFECWSVHSNIEMLSFCLSHISPVSKLHPVLQKYLERMTVYRQASQ